jgi:iron complex transport system ATP-binding protein
VTDKPAYVATELSFRYGAATGGREHGSWAVDGLTFEVHEGEIFGIIGPNGSGKTSVLKLLAKVLDPQRGAVRLFGRDLAATDQQDAARTVALVPQGDRPSFPFTVFETVLMGRFPHRRRGLWSAVGWESAGDLELAQEAMADMDVAHLAARSIHDVSGGERQRAIIARALAQRPRVLLLDEPTAFLDLNHQVEICRILRRLNRERGLTVVLVSHDLNVASQYCDRIMLIERGRLSRIGTPHEVIRTEVLEAAYRCEVLIDPHPISGVPRVTLPGPGDDRADRESDATKGRAFI